MGNPFVHLDLTTGDVAAAKAFYGAIFGWKFQDFPAMNWTGIDVGGGVGGGMGPKQSPEQPTAWTAYVDVADVDQTVARAAAAGATILMPKMEVPGMGWLAVLADPQGAVIGIWQSAAPPPPPPKRAPARKAPATQAVLAKKAPAKKALAKKAPAKKAAPKKAAPKKAAPKKAAPKKAAPKKAAPKKKAGKK
ncbi:MAG: VOC family protein [Myxococcales bacterium]|nr:VOC family protein [Myxococcales bacterium]